MADTKFLDREYERVIDNAYSRIGSVSMFYGMKFEDIQPSSLAPKEFFQPMFFDQSVTDLLLKAVPSLLSLEESAALKSSRGSDYLGSVMVESVIAYFAGKY